MSWRSKERPEHPPIVCAGRRDNALRLTALDEVAERSRLTRGQALAEARVMYPKTAVFDEDEKADFELLEAVADWCDRYTPLVALDGKDGLFLDVSGCAHLFGGEDAMLGDILLRLKQVGFDVCGAISGSPGLSWAMSRFGRGGITAREDMAGALAALPIHALRLDEMTLTGLCKLGLKRIADLMAIPRAPLVRRFGAHLMMRLDQALGACEEAISPRRPVAALSAERQLAEPVQAEEDIIGVTREIAVSLKASLEERGVGGTVFELSLFRVDGRVFRIKVGASRALRDPKTIAGLFCERLDAVHDHLEAGFGFELLRLSVLQHAAFGLLQSDFSGKESQETSLADFIDKVAARFGVDCLEVLRSRQSHIPERAEIAVPAIEAAVRPADVGDALPFSPKSSRPLRLLRRPEPIEAFAAIVPDGPPQRFRWRHVLHIVTRAEGPERIAPEWWLDDDETPERDYYRLEAEFGRLFWVFRLGPYNGKDAPDWRMHGIFA
ncbi:nucleotidyltransferase [Neorhizobium sp. NCHU2750]|nr:nucleotidyltransferase [Neorhizobium sp. NCHU2750]